MTTPDPAQNLIPLFKLMDRELMARIMQRTGTGAAVTVRELAAKAGVPHGTIGNLLTGEQESVFMPSACAICAVLGVDLLVLFAAVGRSSRHTGGRRLEVLA